MTAPDWDNPSVRAGIEAMLASRAGARAEGDGTIGWKLAFGAPTWLEKFGLSGPLVGFLSASRRHEPGALVSCSGWANPVAEPEIALHVGRDINNPGEAGRSIAALGAAIELAAVDPPPENLERVLADNVFHKAVVLGEPDDTRVDGSTLGLRARVMHDGDEVADTSDLESLTGRLVDILGHAAALLGAAGEKIRAGDVVIMGSVIPPIAVEHGSEVTFELAPLAPISVAV